MANQQRDQVSQAMEASAAVQAVCLSASDTLNDARRVVSHAYIQAINGDLSHLKNSLHFALATVQTILNLMSSCTEAAVLGIKTLEELQPEVERTIH